MIGELLGASGARVDGPEVPPFLGEKAIAVELEKGAGEVSGDNAQLFSLLILLNVNGLLVFLAELADELLPIRRPFKFADLALKVSQGPRLSAMKGDEIDLGLRLFSSV